MQSSRVAKAELGHSILDFLLSKELQAGFLFCAFLSHLGKFIKSVQQPIAFWSGSSTPHLSCKAGLWIPSLNKLGCCSSSGFGFESPFVFCKVEVGSQFSFTAPYRKRSPNASSLTSYLHECCSGYRSSHPIPFFLCRFSANLRVFRILVWAALIADVSSFLQCPCVRPQRREDTCLQELYRQKNLITQFWQEEEQLGPPEYRRSPLTVKLEPALFFSWSNG